MSMIEIHRVTAENAPRYAEMLRGLWGETAGAYGEAALALEGVSVLAADVDGQPAGAALVVRISKLDARRGFLFMDELGVLPELRRRGVARALVEHVERQARALGLAGVRLLVRPENEAARRLYAALGYDESESRFCEKKF